jgi:hypothetical protein
MRWKSIAVLGAGLALIGVSPASAGTLTTQNSCLWPDGIWRHLDITVSGVGSPSPVAPGTGLALTQASVHVRLPDYLAEAGYGASLLKPGRNDFDVKAWLAITAPGTPQGTVVFPIETTAFTDITVDDDLNYVSSTPIDVTVALPDSTWTAAPSPVTFHQAAAGTLPRVPAGAAGQNLQPTGSAFISAQPKGGGLRLNIDCRPGSGEGSNEPAPNAAGAFETVQIDPGAPQVIPAPPAPEAKKPALTLRTSKLKRTGKRVSLALACADAPCAGRVTAKYAGGTAAKSVKYTLAAGARKTYKLTLSAKALKSLKRKSLLISVKVTTDGGDTVSKKLRLKK